MVKNRDNLIHKFLQPSDGRGIVEDCKDCGFKRLMEEKIYVEQIASLVEYGNLHILKSFKIKLEFDEEAKGERDY